MGVLVNFRKKHNTHEKVAALRLDFLFKFCQRNEVVRLFLSKSRKVKQWWFFVWSSSLFYQRTNKANIMTVRVGYALCCLVSWGCTHSWSAPCRPRLGTHTHTFGSYSAADALTFINWKHFPFLIKYSDIFQFIFRTNLFFCFIL